MSFEEMLAHRAHMHPRSFNTVLMIYVSGYILHRILSRINVDTGNEAFSRTLQGRDFYVPCKGVRSDLTIFDIRYNILAF